MKSGAVDADRFKVESRQSVNRRKMSKNSPVLNGADGSLNYAAEDDSVVRQVNLAAAYHDHISCTKSPDLCQKMDGAREGRGTLPCETDHIYANCSDIKSKSHTSAAPSNNNTKDLTLENMNLRDMLLSHLDIISHLQEELEKKNKEISERRRESEKLRARLERRERKMCLLRRNFTKSDEDSTDNISEGRSNISNNENPSVTTSTTTAVVSSGHPSVRTPVLATRYFGRRSKTVPSRALKRRYMGPPKSFPAKKITVKTESSTASVSSASEMHDTDCQETLGPTEIREDGIATPGIRRVRKRRGRRPKIMARKMDYLTTDKAYFLPDFRSPPESLSSSEIDVPLWKLKPVTSFYQMEGTENINDSVFARRHQKFEQDERRRKRWDIQRIRDQKAAEKKRAREKENSVQHKSYSFYPDPRHIEYIEVSEQLPVLAFGHLIPLFQPCEFSLPWKCEDNLVSDVPESPSKGKRGRPPTPGPKVT
ncbi:hypothetical protein AVEN_160276-1 [Araneus ventricosus]|uniref:PEHE domain-containing protein n=1 Tax=Araneus ventricosus TaxID=182803 RepID=A0A4Y2MSY8_ARAVE|nr:hypothetical protein AVEN_160276-1 [Araneus ventricosus]